jgi:MerR family copper efflux transcriptional regulator
VIQVSSFEQALQHNNRADQVKGGVHMVVAKPMTIGQLSQRTGVPIKALREYEQLGLIYTLGRSESNYRLFDEEALWCVQVIRTMRTLGLTLKEIENLAALYLERPGEPIGPHFGEKLEAALTRIEARLTDLQALRQRIRDFQSAHAAELAGETDLDLFGSDPRHTLSKFPS